MQARPSCRGEQVGISTKRMSVPFVNIGAQHAAIKAELLEAMGRVIDGGMYVLGAEVDELERQFAELIGVRFAVGLNSGTDALIFALRGLGIGPGDEVITAANSFIASAGCAAMVGARPVLVDVGDDYNIDPECFERAITPRTKAVIPVHLTGRPAKMDAVMRIAKAHNIHVVEDAAQAVCAAYRGTMVGAFGVAGCFSLHPLKTLSAIGDGGILTTNDEALYNEVKVLRNLGLKTRDDAVVWSGNSRLDTIQAAALLVKLKYLEEWTEGRRAHARRYRELLSDLPQVTCPGEEPYERAVYQVFKILADDRDALQRYLAERGIGSAVHYAIPMHLQTVAEELDYTAGAFPVTERQAEQILSIPVYHTLEDEQIEYVAATIREFYAR
jgi:dTDP-4-amino-4,6-dideoxygalactose transaminase